MKRTGIVLGVVGLGFLALRSRAMSRSLQNLQLNLSNFKISFQGFTPVLMFRINAYNPDVEPVNIRSVMGNVLFKNQSIASFNTTNDLNIKVAPKRTVAIESRAVLSLGSLVTALIQKVPGATVDVRGTLFTGAIEIPFVRTWNANTGTVV